MESNKCLQYFQVEYSIGPTSTFRGVVADTEETARNEVLKARPGAVITDCRKAGPVHAVVLGMGIEPQINPKAIHQVPPAPKPAVPQPKPLK